MQTKIVLELLAVHLSGIDGGCVLQTQQFVNTVDIFDDIGLGTEKCFKCKYRDLKKAELCLSKN
jgi:hypothetical protein